MSKSSEDKIKQSYDTKKIKLNHYHCTLFLPLVGLEKSSFAPSDVHQFTYCPAEKQLEDGEAAGYYYFSPTIRNILYDCPKLGESEPLKAIKEWRLSDDTIKTWELHLDNTRSKNEHVSEYQKAKITSVRLLQYFNGLYLLAVRLEPLALYQWKKEESRKEEDFPELIMEDWLHFSRLIRLIYPSFDQQTDENKIAPIQLVSNNEPIIAFDQIFERKEITLPQTLGENFSPVMTEFIKAFAKEPQKTQQQITQNIEFYDDRMFISVAYGVAGDKLPKEALEQINTLVSHIDRQQDLFDNPEYYTKETLENMQGYAYTPEYICKRTKERSLQIWEGIGGYYTYTDYSNTYLSNGWDFKTFIATEHIPHIYDRMLIQALFYQASLRHYDNQICEVTEGLINKNSDIKNIKKLRRNFIEFTNQYWFHKLTEQMQGKEIFALQQKGLGLKEHYDILKDELERTDEYLQTEQEIKENKFNSRVGFYGLIFAIAAIYYSMLPLIENFYKTEQRTLWKTISGVLKCQNKEIFSEQTVFLIALIAPLILIPLGVKVIAWGAYKLFRKP